MSLLLIALAGCEATRIPAYSPEVASGRGALSAQDNGLNIAVDPFFDANRSATYFKANTLKQGLIVLHLQIENRSASSSYLVQKSAFRLSTAGEGGRSAAEASVNRSSGTGDALAMTGAVLGSLPLLFLGGQLTADAEAAHNAGDRFTAKGNKRKLFQEHFDEPSYNTVKAITESPEVRQITPSRWTDPLQAAHP